MKSEDPGAQGASTDSEEQCRPGSRLKTKLKQVQHHAETNSVPVWYLINSELVVQLVFQTVEVYEIATTELHSCTVDSSDPRSVAAAMVHRACLYF